MKSPVFTIQPIGSCAAMTLRRSVTGLAVVFAAFAGQAGVAPLYARSVTDGAFIVAQVPIPPRRPQNLERRQSPPEPDAPQDAPAPSTPLPAPPQRAAPKPQAGEAPYHPITEPGPMSSRRAALRTCFEEWQKMKHSGSAAGRVWRDFSMECMTRNKSDK